MPSDLLEDPSVNVAKLNEASSARQDDLREAQDRLTDEKIKRLEDAVKHSQAIGALRAEYEVRLDVAEAKRIDAIRAVDVNAVAVASQRASDQATVLASQVQQSAEALRTLVATTATAASASQQQVVNTLNERLTRLEQAQYKGEGKQAVADPALVALSANVERLANAQSSGAGKSAGATQMWGYVAGAVGLLLTVMMLFDRFAK